MNNKTKNKIYLYIYNILRNLIPITKGPVFKNNGVNIEAFSKRMMFKLKLAKLFGGPDLIIIGDSNGENLNDDKDNIQLGVLGIICNIARSGSTATDWNYFFMETELGKQMYKLIESFNCDILLNIGGNHLLKGEMNTAARELAKLHSLLPSSWNCLVPPIHSDILEDLTFKPRGSIEAKVKKLNKIIKNEWKDKAIDLYSPFVDFDGVGPYIMVLQDVVHFSQLADETIRIPLFINIFRK